LRLVCVQRIRWRASEQHRQRGHDWQRFHNGRRGHDGRFLLPGADAMTRAIAPFGLALVAVATASCGSSSAGDAPPYVTCGDDVRVGRFTLDLKPAVGDTPAYAQVNGLVRDGVDPKDVWQEIAREGSCHVSIGPVADCAPACAFGMVCRAGGCVAAPAGHPVGTVTMTGLLIPLAMTPNATNASYYGPIPSGTPSPPYEIGGAIGLDTEGGDYPPLSFEVRGIEPLEVADGQALALTTTVPNGALLVTWTPARAGGAGRVWLSLEIAHHAGIAAELDCDVPDTGTARVPGALLDKLVAQGTAGFPGLTATRVSADTATIPPGCVELNVASSVSKAISVEGVTSCSQDAECVAPQICLPSLKCG
jgi:hypothetical protein